MTVVCGVLAGLAFGLTPFGGGLLAVPLLLLGSGLTPSSAIAAALAAMALLGAVGAGDGARSRALETTPALWAGMGGVVGVAAGTMGMDILPAPVWAAGYLAVCVFAALLLWRDGPMHGIRLRAGLHLGAARLPAGRMPTPVPPAHGAALTAAGFGGGVMGGLFGGGASLLVVPAVTHAVTFDRRRALAVALFAVMAVGLAGTATAWWLGRAADWNLTGLFVLSAVASFGFARRLAYRAVGIWWSRVSAVLVLSGGIVAAGTIYCPDIAAAILRWL